MLASASVILFYFILCIYFEIKRLRRQTFSPPPGPPPPVISAPLGVCIDRIDREFALQSLTILICFYQQNCYFSHNNNDHSNIHVSEIFIKTSSIDLLILILLNTSIHEQIRHH